MKQKVSTLLVIAAFAASACFAIVNYLHYADTQSAVAAKTELLSDSQRLFKSRPQAFSKDASIDKRTMLKAIVQDVSNRTGVPLIYLTEVDKDSGDQIREKNVLCRTVNVPQAKLVAFLAELEERSGAHVKELRLKPSADRNGFFQEAEGVVAMRWAVEKMPAKESK